ncbi:MAG TPA: hypothetical protein VFG51_00935 [Candidatus Saccharimonadia bacterium]|nr:hypothetical protein [Candidatus Saccharimonadia bacterium]
MKTIQEIQRAMSDNRANEPFEEPGCSLADKNFLLSLLWGSRHIIQETRSIYHREGSVSAPVITKKIGKTTHLVLEGQYAGFILYQGQLLRPLIHPPRLSSDSLSEIAQLQHHAEGAFKPDLFLPTLFRLLAMQAIPFDRKVMEENISLFSNAYRQQYEDEFNAMHRVVLRLFGRD